MSDQPPTANPVSDPALLAAQAQAGQAGVAAYQAALNALQTQRQQAVQQAMQEASLRGAPGNAVASIQGSITSPIDNQIANLTASQANFAQDQQARASRLTDYNQAILGTRHLIGDQISQAVAPINAKSAADVASLNAQSQAKIADLQGQARLEALKIQAAQQAAAAKAKAAADKANALTSADLTAQLVAAGKQAIPQLQAATDPLAGIPNQSSQGGVGSPEAPATASDIEAAGRYTGMGARQYQEGKAGTPSPASEQYTPAAATAANGSSLGNILTGAIGNLLTPVIKGLQAAPAPPAPGPAPVAWPPPATGPGKGVAWPPPATGPGRGAPSGGLTDMVTAPFPAANQGTPARVNPQAMAQALAAAQTRLRAAPPAPAAGLGRGQTPASQAAAAMLAMAPAAVQQSGQYPIATIQQATNQLRDPAFYQQMFNPMMQQLAQAGFTATPAAQSTAVARALQEMLGTADTAMTQQQTAATKATTAAGKAATKASAEQQAQDFATHYDGSNLTKVASTSGLRADQIAQALVYADDADNAKNLYDTYKQAVTQGDINSAKTDEAWLTANVPNPVLRNIFKAMKVYKSG